MARLLAFFPALVYAGVIFALSDQSHPLAFLPTDWLSQDKLLHAIEYAGFAVLLFFGLRLGGRSIRTAALVAIGLASLYGATDEIHQSFVPGRDASVLDWVADTAGAVLGAVVVGTVALRRDRSAS
ncbi:MAG: VanZ family protein [Deltaproteobacteria bacterium]